MQKQSFLFSWDSKWPSCSCRLVEFDTSVICHVLVYRFGSFLLQVMLSTCQVFAFERYDVYSERVAYLHSILSRQARLAVIRTICKYSG